MTERQQGHAGDMTAPGPEERDPLASRALRTLPAPEHGATFWSELDRHLDAVDAERSLTPAAPVGPTPLAPADEPHPLAADGSGRAPDRRQGTGDLPALVVLDGGAGTERPAAVAPRRDPGRRLLAVAAAVVLIAAVAAGVATRPSGDGDDIEFADSPPITASTTTTTTTSPAPSTASTATAPVTAPVTPPSETSPVTEASGDDPVAAPTSAGDAVIQFVTALAEGDGERADALLGDASREHMASLDIGIDDLYDSLYAAWGAPDVPERLISSPVLSSSGEGTLYTVVLRGTIGSVDGGPSGGDFVTPFFVFAEAGAGTYRVDIYPRGFDDAALVPELVQPALGDAGPQALERGESIRFLSPAADEAYVSIDGGPLEAAEVGDEAWFVDPGPIDTGAVSVVVVTLGAAGISYEAAVIEVVEPPR